MADTTVSNIVAEKHEGSSPSSRTRTERLAEKLSHQDWSKDWPMTEGMKNKWREYAAKVLKFLDEVDKEQADERRTTT